MSESGEATKGPDLTRGVPLTQIGESDILLGHVGDDAVLIARSGDEIFAIGATCTHYNGPLAEGLIVGDTLRCPLHHACFSLRTGEALRAPALDPVTAWRVEQRDGSVYVTDKIEPTPKPGLSEAGLPKKVVIVGGGAAANAAAEMLRREGFAGTITMLSADDFGAGRPAQFVERLPRRGGAGVLDSAALGEILQEARHRSHSKGAGDRSRHGGQRGAARGWRGLSLRQPASGDRRGPRASRYSRRRSNLLSAQLRRRARHYRRGREGQARRRHRRKLHRPSKSRPRYANASSRSMLSGRTSTRSKKSWDQRSATSSAACMKPMACNSILARRRPRSTNAVSRLPTV